MTPTTASFATGPTAMDTGSSEWEIHHVCSMLLSDIFCRYAELEKNHRHWEKALDVCFSPVLLLTLVKLGVC